MKSSKTKHTYFLSTLSISLVLFLLSALFYIGYIVENTASQVVSQIQISALLSDDAQMRDVNSLISTIRQGEDVDSVLYVSKDAAADIYKKATGQDFTLFIDDNPLPASIDIIFESDNLTKERIDELSNMLSNSKIVDEVLRPQGVVSEVLGHVYKIRFVLYSFLVILFLISVVLINNAIKLTTRSKRFLIKSMKLVGATDSFIRRPFIYTAIRQGFNATFIAWMLFLISYIAVNRGIETINFTKEELIPIALIFVGILVVGVIISVVCTAISVNRQMRQRDGDLHKY